MSSRFLIARTDRLGDVLLTTPLNTLIKRHWPDASISWLVRPYAAPLLKGNPFVDQVILFEKNFPKSLFDILGMKKFDVAILAYPRFAINWVTWRARIPMRIGPANKLYSLFQTHRLWQYRSEGRQHEADYNLDLLTPLGIAKTDEPTQLFLLPEEIQWAKEYLLKAGFTSSQSIVILHPGHGGSSPAWPLSSFLELGKRLQKRGRAILFTTGPSDVELAQEIARLNPHLPILQPGTLTLRQFAAILNEGSVVITNSTGPLHMAVALKVKTVSFFSPIPTCHPTRWGPYPGYKLNSKMHRVLLGQFGEIDREALRSIKVDEAELVVLEQLE